MKKSILKMVGGVAAAIMLAACSSGPNERSAGEVFDDTAILTKAKAALVNDPEVKASQIDVDVERGVVTLTGMVRSEAERKKVLETVWGVKGVKSVQTDIRVEAPKP